jgi:peptidoglycan hydrolase CwlO-like protein
MNGVHQVDEQYQKRARMEMELMSEKHQHEMETLKAELEANMRELQEIQNEKKMMLTQHENKKLKERDEQHTHELRDWRSDLTKRRQALEEKFEKQREDHERFYSTFNPRNPLSAAVDSSERPVKAASFSGNSPRHNRPSHPNRSSLQPLDEVVMTSSANSSLPASRQASRPITNGSNA